MNCEPSEASSLRFLANVTPLWRALRGNSVCGSRCQGQKIEVIMHYKLNRRFVHPELGEVAVREHATTTRFTGRWKSPDLLLLTIPRHTTPSLFRQTLEKLVPRLTAIRPTRRTYAPGWRFHTPEMDFVIAQSEADGAFRGTVDRINKETVLYMPRMAADTDITRFHTWVKAVLDNYAKKHASAILLPLAREYARVAGVSPRAIAISYGQRVLGRCNAKGEILLSRNLVFYPEELRRLVIMHEFAHLTHLNHSPSFYALLNQYLGGDHARLRHSLKTFQTPLL